MNVPNINYDAIIGKLINVAIVIVVLVVVGFLVNSWIEKQEDKKRQEQVETFNHDTAVNTVNEQGMADAVNAVERAKLKQAQEALKLFDPKPIGDTIYNSTGLFNDNEDELYSAFGKLKNRLELSLLNYYFVKLYHKDLMTFITESFNPKEIQRVQTIISKLKPY